MEAFKEILENNNEFIKNPLDFIYDSLDDTSSQNIKEAISLILKHNKIILEKLKKENLSMQELIKKATAPEVPKNEEDKDEELTKQIVTKKDVTDKVEKIFYTLDECDFKNFVKNISSEELPFIKLEILKRIKELEKKLKQIIILNPTNNVSNIQEDLLRYQTILQEIECKNEENENENKQDIRTNILILPNKKNSTFLYADVLAYIESGKEIKIAVDKIIDGYFLKTKDTKPIVGKSEKLYEYKNPNGIRILYIVLPNDYVVITGLFYKDKEKSTKIDAYYEEAISRYLQFKDYINNNIKNPDFYIEQAEFKGNIYDLLDKTSKKSRGE